jgi:hypothetical protein
MLIDFGLKSILEAKVLFVHYRNFQQRQATILLPISCGKR